MSDSSSIQEWEPNDETRKAIEDARTGNVTNYASMDAMMNDLQAPDKVSPGDAKQLWDASKGLAGAVDDGAAPEAPAPDDAEMRDMERPVTLDAAGLALEAWRQSGDKKHWSVRLAGHLGEKLAAVDRLTRERDEAQAIVSRVTCSECGNHDKDQFRGVRASGPFDPEEWECECQVCGSWAVFPSLPEAFDHARYCLTKKTDEAVQLRAENADLRRRLAYTGPERRKADDPWRIPARVGWWSQPGANNGYPGYLNLSETEAVQLESDEYRRLMGRRKTDWSGHGG